ncbi:MAG: FCD domain-containing protein [Geminicoccaceae bacterium]
MAGLDGNGTDGADAGAGEPIEPIVTALRALVAGGKPLPAERALAQRLAVKRHRLRRALELMRRSGELAPARTGRRPLAGTPRPGEALIQATNPLEVIELRLMLEPMLARLAALRASPAEIARVQQAATTPPGSDYGLADLSFHNAVAAAARNSLAVEFCELLRQIGRDARVRLGNGRPLCEKRLQRRDAEHQAVAKAIAARDPDEAERAMRAHLAAVQRQITERLNPGLTAA